MDVTLYSITLLPHKASIKVIIRILPRAFNFRRDKKWAFSVFLIKCQSTLLVSCSCSGIFHFPVHVALPFYTISINISIYIFSSLLNALSAIYCDRIICLSGHLFSLLLECDFALSFLCFRKSEKGLLPKKHLVLRNCQLSAEVLH